MIAPSRFQAPRIEGQSPDRDWPAANRARAYLTLLGCALVGAIALYYPTTRFGFVYDDYHWVRPYSSREVLSSFWGTWDATHLEVAFYRPLTVTLYALRFLIFGFHASAYHWASIVIFAAAAALFGAFLLRLFHSLALAVAGTALLLIHPAATDTLVAWTINQYQLAEIILFLCALHWWLTCAGKRTRRWLPLIPFAALCFLFKEDGIMVLPAIFIIAIIGARLLHRPLAPPPMMYALACATVGALTLLHYGALRGMVGGYGVPSLGTVFHNLILGPRHILLGQYGPEWSAGCTMYLLTALTLLGGIAAFAWKNRRAMFLILGGVTVLFAFDLPLAIVGRTDPHFLPVHFLTIGHVFILLGAGDALCQATTRAHIPRLVPIALLALSGIAVFLGLLLAWPPRVTTYSPTELNVRDGGTFYPSERDPSGNEFAWTAAHTFFVLDILPRKPIRLITEVRSAAVAGGPDEPVHVRINGQDVGQLHPNARETAFQSLPLSFVPPSSDSGRLRVEYDAAPFRARRELGTMIRSVSVDTTNAWSGIERRMWLYWALPCLAALALVCAVAARRSQYTSLGIAAIVVAAVACACGALLLFLVARVGTLDTSRSWAWLFGCGYLEALCILGTVALLRAWLGEGDAQAADSSPVRRVATRLLQTPVLPAAVTLWVIVAVTAANLVFIARQQSLDWHPYSPFTLQYDGIVADWGDAVPPELRQVLEKKQRITTGR